MKKWWLIPLILISLITAVNGKCGDYLCDPNEDCESCPDDCLCTKGEHYALIECCNDFTCQECEKGYCHNRKCDDLEGFMSIFKKIACFDNGSINMEVTFLELKSIILMPDEDLKVYMKEKKDDASFKEITGTWINPSREGDFKYTKIADTSTFTSDKDLFKLPGKYYVRVKYKLGRSNSIFEDTEVSCPGTPQEPSPIVQEEPEMEDMEPPREEEFTEEPKEIVEKEAPETLTEEPKEESSLVWYMIIGIIILIAIIFFIKYEIKITKKQNKL